MLLKQSTARSLTVLMIDSTDHIAGKTGLTLTITASKDGGSFASISPTVTELANGWYKLALTTSHTDTLGDLALHITGTGADATDIREQVVVDLPGGSVSSVTGAVGSVTGNVGGSVASVTARVTANTDQLAGQSVTAGAGVTFPSSVASPTNITAGTITTVTNLTNAPTAGDLTAAMKASVNAEVDSALDTAIPGTPTANSINERIQTMDNAYTAARGALLDHLDADVSSRGTYSGGAIVGNITGNLSGSVGSVTGAVGSVTGNVGGNVTGSVGSVASGGITASSFGASAIDAAALATDAGQEIADRVLARNVAGGSDTGRTIKLALYRLINRVGIAAGTMTVYATDDSTSAWTAAVTTTAGNPVSEVDPT